MAEQTFEAQQFADALARATSEFERYGKITQSTQNDVSDASMKAQFGLSNFTKASASGATAVLDLGKAMGQATKAMYDGKKGAAAFNDSVDSITMAAQAAATGLLLLSGPIGLIGAAVIGAIGALGAYTKAANEMSDKLYKGYQGLAQSGAAAADGMDGLFEDAKKLGLSMNELGTYTQLIGENSKDLALFAGSAYQGRKAFADVGKDMEQFKLGLMNTGLTQDQINAGAMSYLRLQTRIGLSQTQTTKELADGANKYLLEMDGLSKITGETRKSMEDQMEAARNEERFAAKLQDLRANGHADYAHQLEITSVMLSSQSKEAGQGFRDLSTGMITTDAAQKLYLSTQGKALEQADKLSTGLATAAESTQVIGTAAGATAKNLTSLGKMGVYGETFGDYAGSLRLGIFAQNDLVKAQKDAEAQIGQQIAGADAAVDANSKLIIQQQKANEATERFVKAGVVAATQSMTVLASGATAAANALNRVAGITPSSNAAQQPRSAVGSQMGPVGSKVSGTMPSTGGGGGGGGGKGGGAAPAAAAPKPSAPAAAAPAAAAGSQMGPTAPAQKDSGDMQRAPNNAQPPGKGGGGGGAMNDAATKAMIARHEGTRDQPYKDSLGLWTVGVGHLIGDGKSLPDAWNRKFSKEEIMALFDKDYDHHKNAAASNTPNFEAMGGNMKSAFVDLAFNMGPTWMSKWPTLKNQLGSKNADAAADNLAGSKWAGQVGNRAGEIVGMVKSGFARDGGMFSGPESGYPMTMHGAEAVIPLKGGSVPVSISLKDAMSQQNSGAGLHEYGGYNMGPASTDIGAVKDIAEKLGAFDRATQTITNPDTWKQIIQSGIAMNFTTGLVEMGTNLVPGIGVEIGKAVKDLQEQKQVDTETALKEITKQWADALPGIIQASMASNPNLQGYDSEAKTMASLLEELVAQNKISNDIQSKILRSAN